MTVILAGGHIKNYEAVKKFISGASYIICADGGTKHARAMGILPNVIIGDMDSVDHDLINYYQSRGAVVHHYPREKDEVDTELAIREAARVGSRDLLLLGATGGRIDHTLANIHLLLTAANLGVRARIADEQHCITLVTPQYPAEIKGNQGEVLSLIPLTTEVKGVNSRGLKWELNDRDFKIGNPFGISNELSRPSALITVQDGILLMIRVWEKGG
ncbi:MAG: thiamine diphosphokinase [Desulfotomaculum sp.]|nr:thiamine diphosphokinase [Desulfotomaculum sp.]